jgi:CheY-like chemotaxis protein
VTAVDTTGDLESTRPPAPILVAEDNADARAMFARLLAKAGVVNPIAFAEDGQAAIEYLAAVASGKRPEPVGSLRDLHMPRKTGLDVLRWIRSEGALPTTPVVILTGSAEMDDVRECHNLGAASYLVKPVGFAALNDVLRGLELRWALLPTT